MSQELRRFCAALVVGASAIAGSVVNASPANALPTCNATQPAHWTGSKGYTYTPGHWCMNAIDGADPYNLVVFQTDGNVVWYTGGHVLRASGTNAQGATRLVFQTDGNIVVYAGSKALWADGQSRNHNAGTQYYWETQLLQNDPNRIYELSAFQTSPSLVTTDQRVTYNG